MNKKKRWISKHWSTHPQEAQCEAENVSMTLIDDTKNQWYVPAFLDSILQRTYKISYQVLKSYNRIKSIYPEIYIPGRSLSPLIFVIIYNNTCKHLGNALGARNV